MPRCIEIERGKERWCENSTQSVVFVYIYLCSRGPERERARRWGSAGGFDGIDFPGPGLPLSYSTSKVRRRSTTHLPI